MALTSMLAVMASGTVAILDRGPDAAQIDARDRSVATLRAAIRTDWMNPADARRSIEARSAALEEWLRVRGGAVRDMGTSSLLRTHGADGARLTNPLARFERILEIQVPQDIEFAHAQRALLGPDGSVAVVTPSALVMATRRSGPPISSSEMFSAVAGT